MYPSYTCALLGFGHNKSIENCCCLCSNPEDRAGTEQLSKEGSTDISIRVVQNTREEPNCTWQEFQMVKHLSSIRRIYHGVLQKQVGI